MSVEYRVGSCLTQRQLDASIHPNITSKTHRIDAALGTASGACRMRSVEQRWQRSASRYRGAQGDTDLLYEAIATGERHFVPCLRAKGLGKSRAHGVAGDALTDTLHEEVAKRRAIHLIEERDGRREVGFRAAPITR